MCPREAVSGLMLCPYIYNVNAHPQLSTGLTESISPRNHPALLVFHTAQLILVSGLKSEQMKWCKLSLLSANNFEIPGHDQGAVENIVVPPCPRGVHGSQTPWTAESPEAQASSVKWYLHIIYAHPRIF